MKMEIWKLIEINGYFISNYGNLKGRFGKIMKLHINKNGYYSISLKPNGKHGKAITKRIHQLVASAFIPNPNNLPCINHKDGNKLNNSVENLEWCTYSQNSRHAINTGLTKFDSISGENNLNHKLTQEQVNWIRNNYIPRDKDFGCRALAKKFNVSHVVISSIINNLHWSVSSAG